MEEKERRREAEDVAAAAGAAGSSSGRANALAVAAVAAANARRLALEAAQAAAVATKRANDKDRISRVLYQRQSEDWAHAHGQAPPRRKLAPAVTKVVEQWFALVDNDKAGVLRAAELAAALQAAGVPCGESDVLELVRLIDVNHDGSVTWGEFQTFLLKEFAAGKNLINGDYMLPSGKRLPFGAMIARLKRQRVLEDVMKGGTARMRYVDMLYNRDALATEIGLTEAAAATLDQYAPPTRHRIHQPHGGGDSRGGEDSDGFISRSALSHTTRGGTGGPDSFIVPRSGHILMSWRDGRKRAAEALPNELAVGSLASHVGASNLAVGSGGGSLAIGGLAGSGLAGGGLAGGGLAGGGGGLAAAAAAGGVWGMGSSRAGSRPSAPAAEVTAVATGGPGAAVTAGGEGSVDGSGFGETESGATFYTPHSASAAVLHGICVPAPPPVPGAPVSEGGEAIAAALLLRSDGDDSGGEDADDGPALFLTEVAGILEADPSSDPKPNPDMDTEPKNTRAFQRALLSVRREAPATLLRRIRMAHPRQAAAAATAHAAANGPPLPPPYALVLEPVLSPESSGISRRRGGGPNTRRGGEVTYGSAARGPDGVDGGRPPSPMEPISPTDADLVSPDPSSLTVSASATMALPHHITKYGAGFTRYKRWSMYAIDPAAENPEYWQAPAATAAAVAATARDMAHRSSLQLPLHLPMLPPLPEFSLDCETDENDERDEEAESADEDGRRVANASVSFVSAAASARAAAAAATASGLPKSGGEAQLLRRHELLAAQHVQARQQHRLLHEQLVAQQRLLRSGRGKGEDQRQQQQHLPSLQPQATSSSPRDSAAASGREGVAAALPGEMWAVPRRRQRHPAPPEMLALPGVVRPPSLALPGAAVASDSQLRFGSSRVPPQRSQGLPVVSSPSVQGLR
ncbi:hypothetical protein TSOC_003114 [Tetrabaena socialis]|uniref:EF-hand domain-containing protein n=1 Tax=Tetrabaena socialis TaxID=47790 RepID=A0A2J8ACC5_9CHLO|nr:hypothetical protein TSOC_003114 [Tetrabaena socialis]|eukprot:PNH10172.1 hypothetical protein TSOC_003114 [Tetrabaena socialis]